MSEARRKERNFPFVGASNVVVPTIGTVCDALASRSLAQVTAAAPTYWMCRSENEQNADMARNMGYASEEHRLALRRLGPSPIHRRSFGSTAQGWLFS